MKKFMVGMYEKYDDIKFNKDFREKNYGIEACLFRDESDIEKLINNTKRKNIKK